MSPPVIDPGADPKKIRVSRQPEAALPRQAAVDAAQPTPWRSAVIEKDGAIVRKDIPGLAGAESRKVARGGQWTVDASTILLASEGRAAP